MAKKISEIEMDLSGYHSMGVRATIFMRSKKVKPFLALVKDIDFGLDNPKVIFVRCEGTEDFPVEGNEFITEVKNVKDTEFMELDFLRKMNE